MVNNINSEALGCIYILKLLEMLLDAISYSVSLLEWSLKSLCQLQPPKAFLRTFGELTLTMDDSQKALWMYS